MEKLFFLRLAFSFHIFQHVIHARNHWKYVTCEAKHSLIENKFDNLSSSSTNRSFWSLAISISNNLCHSTFPSLFHADDTMAVSLTDKATLFSSLFSSNSILDDSNIPAPSETPLTNPMPLPIISFHAVKKIFLCQDISKADGQDSIPPRVLKECASELTPMLARLFCFCSKPKLFLLPGNMPEYSIF